MLRWFRTTPHSPCSSAAADSASRRFARLPSAGAVPGKSVAPRAVAPAPNSSHPFPWPTAPICRRRPRRPKSPSAGDIAPPYPPIPAWRRPDPECWPDAPPLPAKAPGYPPQYAVCGPSPSCPHRNPLAPLFRSLYRLAVNDRCAGADPASFGLTAPVPQSVMRPLPASIPAPSSKVMESSAPGWQVMRQHPPRAPGAQYIADGVHHLPARVLDGTAAGFGRRQQWFQQLPLPVVQVGRISWSIHAPRLRQPARSSPSCPHASFLLFRHPLRKGYQILAKQRSREKRGQLPPNHYTKHCPYDRANDG